MSQMGQFETAALTQPRNLQALTDLPGRWAEKVRRRKRIREIVLDVDSTVSETYGNQEGSAYNGYYETYCYHPLVFGSADSGQLEHWRSLGLSPPNSNRPISPVSSWSIT